MLVSDLLVSVVASVNAAERADRDQRILQLWIAGGSYLRIAKAVGLTQRRVEQVVKAELAAGAGRRALLTEEALAVHQERVAVHQQRRERLFEVHLKKAENGDHQAAELCRRLLADDARLLDQNARLYGLYGDASPLPAPTAPLTGEDGGGQESEEADELSKLRARRGTAG